MMDTGWPVFHNHSMHKRSGNGAQQGRCWSNQGKCEMAPRPGPPVLGGKWLMPKVGVGGWLEPGASGASSRLAQTFYCGRRALGWGSMKLH